MSTIPQNQPELEPPSDSSLPVQLDRRYKSDTEYHLELAAKWRVLRLEIQASRKAERDSKNGTRQ